MYLRKVYIEDYIKVVIFSSVLDIFNIVFNSNL